MAVNLSPVGGVAAQFFNNDGVPLAGGLIYTYLAGTSTPAATYTTGTGNIEHTNPIVLDSAGRVPTGEIWLTDSIAYKFVIKDANLTLIGTYDNIVGINSNFVNYTSSQEIQTATQGQTTFTLNTMVYQPGTNSISVFVNGSKQINVVNYNETSASVITFVDGLNDGDLVNFTTSIINNVGSVDASQVTYNPPFNGAVSTNVEAKLAQFINAKDFGVVGDGITDDYDAFVAAVAEAKALNVPLNIDNLKIYLGTQNASIVSDGLFIQGNGYIETYVDYPYQAGGDFFNNHKNAALDKVGSVIFSRYNGPIFTGKTFSGKGFSVFCDMTESLSSGFKQTTPTSYPGWSQALKNLTSVYVANCGNCGIWLLGGLEVVNLTDIHTFQVNQWGFRVDATAGVNCPTEYLWIQNCSFQWSYWNNIALNAVSKNIYIQNCLLNAPQQLPRLTDGGFTIASYSDVVPCIYIHGADNSVGNFNINILDNYAEQTNGLLTLNCDNGYRFQGVIIQGNTVYLDQTSADYYMVQFQTVVFDMLTYNNRINQGVVYYFPFSVLYVQNQFLNFADQATIVPPNLVVNGGQLYDKQLVPVNKWPTSASVGDGTAATFTFTIPAQQAGTVGTGIIPTIYLISANWQSNNADNFGAYLMTVVRMSTGNYIGSVVAFGSTSGFTAPPSISTSGVISVPLAQYYRGRVSRIDRLATNPGYNVDFA